MRKLKIFVELLTCTYPVILGRTRELGKLVEKTKHKIFGKAMDLRDSIFKINYLARSVDDLP